MGCVAAKTVLDIIIIYYIYVIEPPFGLSDSRFQGQSVDVPCENEKLRRAGAARLRALLARFGWVPPGQ